jgi:hypothetical protein
MPVHRSILVVGVLLSCFSSLGVVAETPVGDAVKFSDLSRAAMECSQLTQNTNEEKRLFDIAMTTGKTFLGIFEKLSDEEKEQVKGQWNFAWWFAYKSPGNYDFKLGQLWTAIKFDRDLAFDREDKERKRNADFDLRNEIKENSYRQKNCIFIH